MIKTFLYRLLVDHFPQFIIQREWLKNYGHKIDWKNPKDLNEKIQWLICFGDTARWPMLADKYRVREFVAAKGYGHILTKLYGVWDNAAKIDYDSLPEKCVLKCNHDCGSYQIVNKSEGFNIETINKSLNDNLRKKFGYFLCEPHYNKIQPLILAEEFLEDKNNSFSFSLVDYKIWCFDGIPDCISVCYNRTAHTMCHELYDINWKPMQDKCLFSDTVIDGGAVVPKPTVLDEMLQIASDLSQGLPEARIDLYLTDNIIHFGEITLTGGAGRMALFTEDYLIELGKKVNLN
jgi:hypothetical protein